MVVLLFINAPNVPRTQHQAQWPLAILCDSRTVRPVLRCFSLSRIRYKSMIYTIVAREDEIFLLLENWGWFRTATIARRGLQFAENTYACARR